MAEEQEKRGEDTKEIKAARERSRSRDRRRRAGDRDFRARSRSRSRDRRRSRSPRGGRDRDRDRRRRSRSRSRSGDRDRKSHRSRRNRFDDDSGSGSDREERRKKAATAAPAAGAFPGPPGGAAAAAAADPFAALRAANPALAGLDPTAASMLMRQQMMLQQQLLLQQQAALQAQQVMSKAASSQTATAAQRLQEKQLKAQRELFVGNLAPGAVSEASLYQVFHSALVAAFPQAAQPGQEPVLRVTLSGRFAFVEFRAAEYATAALQLNGQIALMGNTLKIARPASYVEMPAGGMLGGLGGAVAPAAAAGVPGLPGGLPGAPAVPGVAPGGVAGVSDPLATAMPTPFLCLTGMVTAGVLADDDEFREVAADLQQECSKYGAVVEVKIPRPPPGSAEQLFGTDHYGKAFVQFADVPSAQKAKDAIHGRLFAGSVVQAFHITLPSYQSIPAGIQQS